MAPFFIGLKEKRKGERKREGGRKKKKDEVSWGPVPSLFFGTYNLGKELRGKKGRDRRMGRGHKRKRKKKRNKKSNGKLREEGIGKAPPASSEAQGPDGGEEQGKKRMVVASPCGYI